MMDTAELREKAKEMFPYQPGLAEKTYHWLAADEIERLRAALTKTQIGVNHIATYRTDKWPDYGADHEVALEKLGAGREYDMWCCWNAAMTARDELAQPLI